MTYIDMCNQVAFVNSSLFTHAYYLGLESYHKNLSMCLSTPNATTAKSHSLYFAFVISKIHSKLRSITHVGNQSARDITEFCSVSMDA